jgi:mRNA interferase RelE/StbE
VKVIIRPRAGKQLLGLPWNDADRIRQRIRAYAADPRHPGHDVVRLADPPPTFRLRVGDWRVLFDVDDDNMIVVRILHRREAYR